MPVQTTYSQTIAPGFPGLIWDEGHHSMKTAAIQAEASEEIAFGTFVARAASTDRLLKPKALRLAASSDYIFGAVLHSHSYNRETDLGTLGLKPKTVMDILEVGVLWMLAEEDVLATDAVYARYATGAGGTIRGALRNDADTASAVLVKGARFLADSRSVTLLGQTFKIVPVEFNALVQRSTL